MRVLLNCLSSVSGGAIAYLRNLSPRLVALFAASGEHELMLLAHDEQRPLLRGIEPALVHWLSGGRSAGISRLRWEKRNLPSITREHKCDVLFTPYQVSPRVPGVRNVMMIRNMEPFLFDGYSYSPETWLRNRLLRWLSSTCLREADRVIAVSQFAEEQLVRGLGIDSRRVRTVYHGSTDLWSGVDGASDRSTLESVGVEGAYLLTAGSFLPYRRCEDVIAAFNWLAPSLPSSMRLVIAGSGADRRYAETIRQAIASSPIRERISLLGHVSWETMAALYRHCVACVISTEIEACPNIAIEAMAAGCVIVSADRSPLPEMFNGCSLEYQSRDIEDLARQISAAVENDALRGKLKTSALKRVAEFSWEACAIKTYSALVNW
jgi:glycosyltransferase involved in cell wall biosynthesis